MLTVHTSDVVLSVCLTDSQDSGAATNGKKGHSSSAPAPHQVPEAVSPHSSHEPGGGGALVLPPGEYHRHFCSGGEQGEVFWASDHTWRGVLGWLYFLGSVTEELTDGGLTPQTSLTICAWPSLKIGSCGALAKMDLAQALLPPAPALSPHW